jgi:hypothetical protein
MKEYSKLFFALIFSAWSCAAQQSTTAAKPKEWKFAIANNLYLIRNNMYASPSFATDKKHLHLEARYNYEGMETGSIFGGYNVSIGHQLKINATPILGVVFGNKKGIAPGLLLDTYYRKLNLYSESEYLVDYSGKESSYYYTWSELTIAPTGWMKFGMAIQRTKLYQTNLDIQRGVSLGFTKKFLTVTGYLFNMGWDNPLGILRVAAKF